MKRGSFISIWFLACALALTLVACGGEEDTGSGREAEFAAIRDQKGALDAKRDEIRALEDQIATAGEAADAAESAEGEGVDGEVAVPAEDLDALLAEMLVEVDEVSVDFMTALVTFLNTAEMLADEVPTGLQLEAIRIKSSEDMLIAQEFIDRGGDYRHAIEVLTTALELDPENLDLVAARDQVMSERFMTPERFEVVSKGMALADVQSLLGLPLPRNVRDYPEKKRLAWYYRREDKGAAGVFFEEKDGEMIVYLTDFDFVKSNE